MSKHSSTPQDSGKLGLIGLIAIVVSSMIGSGIDGLPQNMAETSAIGPIILAWTIAGFGMFFIARTFMTLSNVRPDLQSGIYMYAQEGFGKFIAFLVAWGYWLMTMFSNVAFAIMVMDSLDYFVPGTFTGGNNIPSIIGASILIWGFNYLVLSGTQVAGFLNFIGTVAKLIPLVFFIILVLYFFRSTEFLQNFWGLEQSKVNPIKSIYIQTIAPLDVALWCFIGVESAVALSGRAKNKKDISKATFIGFIISLALCMVISIIPFGVLPQVELGHISTPSTAGVVQKISGNWAEIIINIGVIVSILSSWLAWTMICAEIPMIAAMNKTFPKVFTKTNQKGAASLSLWTSSAIMQLTVVLVYFSKNAWLTMLSISAVTVLPAYFASAAYLMKMGLTGELNKYSATGRVSAVITGTIGSIFCIFMVYASGLHYAMLAPLLLTIGIPIYIWVKKHDDHSPKIFDKLELIYLIFLLIFDIFIIYAYIF